MGDYFQHGPYNSIAEFIPDKPWASEMRIGDYMMRRGFVSAIIKGDGYVRHIGDGRGIRN
jgi:tRNA G37 N-methylase TrmD